MEELVATKEDKRLPPSRPSKEGYRSIAESAADQVWEELQADIEWAVGMFEGEFQSGRTEVKQDEYLSYRREQLEKGNTGAFEDWMAQVGPEVFIHEVFLALELPSEAEDLYMGFVSVGMPHDEAVQRVNAIYFPLPVMLPPQPMMPPETGMMPPDMGMMAPPMPPAPMPPSPFPPPPPGLLPPMGGPPPPPPPLPQGMG